MPSGVYERTSVRVGGRGRKNLDLRTIAQLLQSSKDLDTFYLKMKEVYKDKYTLQNISSYWKERSKIIPRNLIETHTAPATGPTNGFLKDAETYLAEIVNELRINTNIQQEILALFKRLEEKPRETK